MECAFDYRSYKKRLITANRNKVTPAEWQEMHEKFVQEYNMYFFGQLEQMFENLKKQTLYTVFNMPKFLDILKGLLSHLKANIRVDVFEFYIEAHDNKGLTLNIIDFIPGYLRDRSTKFDISFDETSQCLNINRIK